MTGFVEYLLHADFKLFHYDNIHAAARKHEVVRLNLIRLSDADLMDLGPVLATSLEEAQDAERQKSAPNGDDWGVQELGPANSSGISWTPMQYIPVHDIQWPFRVKQAAWARLEFAPCSRHTLRAHTGTRAGSAGLPGSDARFASARGSMLVPQRSSVAPLVAAGCSVYCHCSVYKGASLARAVDFVSF